MEGSNVSRSMPQGSSFHSSPSVFGDLDIRNTRLSDSLEVRPRGISANYWPGNAPWFSWLANTLQGGIMADRMHLQSFYPDFGLGFILAYLA